MTDLDVFGKLGVDAIKAHPNNRDKAMAWLGMMLELDPVLRERFLAAAIGLAIDAASSAFEQYASPNYLRTKQRN